MQARSLFATALPIAALCLSCRRERGAPARAPSPTAARPPAPAPATPATPAPVTPAVGALHCTARWAAPRSLGPGRGALHLAAHGTEAHVVLPRHADAYEGQAEPRGDSSDYDGYAYAILDVGQAAGAHHVQEDPLPPVRNTPWGDHGAWSNAMAAPLWTAGGWSRWQVAGAWGTAACTPGGGSLARIGPAGVERSRVTTLLTREVLVAPLGAGALGVWLGANYPEAAACNVRTAIEAMVPQGAGWSRAPLYRARTGTADADVDALTLATSATEAAVLWRESGRRLMLARVDPRGHLIAPPYALVQGPARQGGNAGLGAPAAAYLGDDLVVAWAERPAPGRPYRLRYMQWNPATAASSVAQWARPEGADNQLAPALASDGARLALAWSEGDLARTGGVYAVAVTGGAAQLERAAAERLSGPEAHNARDPEVALAGPLVWVAWQEFTGGRDGAMTVLPLECP